MSQTRSRHSSHAVAPADAPAASWRQLCTTYRSLKEAQETKSTLRDAVSLLTLFDATEWVDLGNIMLLQNDTNGAIHAFHQALFSDHHHAEALTGIKNAIASQKDIDFNKMLEDACELGITSSVKLALQHGAHPTRDHHSTSALHIAAKYGHADCLDLLLQVSDCLIDARDTTGATPLHYAAFHGQAACVKVLLQFHADVTCVDTLGKNALHHAAYAHQSLMYPNAKQVTECMHLLLAAGCNITAIANHRFTVRQIAHQGGKKFALVNTFIHAELVKIANRYYAKAAKLGEEGQHKKAINAIKKALMLLPNNPVGWNNEAYHWNQLKRYKNALMCAKRANQLDTTFASAWQQCGSAYYGLGKYKKALACYNTAMKLHPNKNYNETEQIACQNRITELRKTNHLCKRISAELENYKFMSSIKLHFCTLFNHTFFYNKSLSAQKETLVNELIEQLARMKNRREVKALLQDYLKKDKALAKNHAKQPASFSQLLESFMSELERVPCVNSSGIAKPRSLKTF